MRIYTDFASILTMITLLIGLIWLADRFYFRKRRLNNDPESPEPKIVDYARTFFPVLLLVVVLRAFIAEPFRIPSGSMKPTLLVGDFILVNKFTYGLRLPIFGTRFLKFNEPKHGDILVFRYPQNPKVDFIKRVIGLPGDKISYKDKILYINGKALTQEFTGTVQDSEGHLISEAQAFVEDLDGLKHAIFIRSDLAGLPDKFDEITVPDDQYFVMGDNRDQSGDSRIWGYVPETLIIGKAFFVWFSWDNQAKDVRWSRMFRTIKSL